ncbi:MAG TPA: NADH-quinone oxidoreductase subunit L [Gemmataceae bacterium]|nr:NADH-quinone oxidoreductase subunit L [Gemmataceae bacterium]
MQNPGQLYVWATLLPLASFLLLLLAGATRAAARPLRQTAAGAAVYNLLGGDRPVRTGAYVATGAMSMAFVLSLIGFILFQGRETHGAGHRATGHAAGVIEKGHGSLEQEKLASAEARAEDAWRGSVTWAALPELAGKPAVALALGYRIDSLTAIMFLMVTFIASVIHLFSIGYMADELEPIVEDHQVHTDGGPLRRRGRFGRFFLFLSLFCFSMLNLVLADNLFQVFLSWELVGICSYLLVGFYYERRSASNAANKAFITNRVGDAGFIIGLLILWTYVGTFNFQEIFERIRCPAVDSHGELMGPHVQDRFIRAEFIPATEGTKEPKLQVVKEGSQIVLFPAHFHREELSEPFAAQSGYDEDNFGSIPYWLLVAAGLGVFLGCVGKSAQFPLHVWLPDAMEGPTPVSALIHAATMVAAGVYLVGRTYPLFTPEALLVIAYTGGITLFMAATIAVVMTDIKKVLAYSTVSQLGYMMLGLGVGGWVAGLFHLLTHACFKALLFLGSGSVIYGCHHEQDMRKMGGLRHKMPFTAYTMLIGLLAIAGIPLFSGWYSKDAILAHAYGFFHENPKHLLLILLPLLTAGITAFYMFRMWLLTFAGEPRDHHVYEHAHESPWVMTLPLVLLAILSFAVAWGWPLYDAEASVLDNQIHHSQPASVTADFSAVTAYAKGFHFVVGLVALAIVGIGILFASLLYYSRVLDPAEAKEQFPGIYQFLWNKWYFDELYSAILVRPAIAVAQWCRAFDFGFIDRTVDALGRFTIRLAQWDGAFDLGIIDGLANLTARVVYACGGWLRTIQTGYIRSYVLFLVLAAVGIFFVLTYVMSLAFAQ